LDAWQAGRPAKNKGHQGGTSFWTDGYNIYSYDLKIGYTDETGHKVGLEYTTSGEFVSMTTSCHVGSVRSAADRMEMP
jgi:hypothetical protein